MTYITLNLLTPLLAIATSIYSLSINSADGTIINFDDFRNKKILLVNIATGSDKVSQLGQLQQLQQQYGNSVVVIGFPSNSFNNESRSNEQIKQFCQSQYGVSFRLAAKGVVKGSGIQPVYSWLTHQSENGSIETEVKGDFQKYLIDQNGELLGVFSANVSPLDPQIISNLTN